MKNFNETLDQINKMLEPLGITRWVFIADIGKATGQDVNVAIAVSPVNDWPTALGLVECAHAKVRLDYLNTFHRSPMPSLATPIAPPPEGIH